MNKKIQFFIFSSFLFLVSCGQDSSKKPPPDSNKTSSSGNAQLAQQCGCTTEYKPVCGMSNSGTIQTFDNECISKCFSTYIHNYMRCEKDQSDSQSVCYQNRTRNEKDLFKELNPLTSFQYQYVRYGGCNQVQL